MISRAVVCPSPPLLAAGLTGRAAVAADLARACADAVARLLDGGPDTGRPDTVAVVAGGPATRTWDPGSRLDLAAYGPGLPPGSSASAGKPRASLPLGLGIGAMLLDEAGYTGARLLQAVAADAPVRECLDLGAALASTALLVVGDGTARRTPKAPGHFDERAAGFDAAAERALRSGDLAALAGLDPLLAGELMATGRAAWQVLAGALPSAQGEVLYADAPFGVFYLVAVLAP
jgi:hypothetical protein